MAFQPIPNAGTATVRGVYADGTKYANVFGVDLLAAGSLTQGDADNVADALATAYNLIDGYWSTDFSLVDVVLTDQRTEGAPEFVSTSSFPIAGDNAGDLLPLQTSAVISWQSQLRGRSYRGRTYLGGFAEQYSDGKVIDSSLMTALQDFADSIVLGGQFVIISRYHDKVKRDEGSYTSILAGTPNPHWRSQRRRQYN